MKPLDIETAVEAGSKACVGALTAYAPDILDVVASRIGIEDEEGVDALHEFGGLLLPLLSCVVSKLFLEIGEPAPETARDFIQDQIEAQLKGWLNDEVRYAVDRSLHQGIEVA